MKKIKNLKIFDFQKSKLQKIDYRKILNENFFKHNGGIQIFFDRFFEIFFQNIFFENVSSKKK